MEGAMEAERDICPVSMLPADADAWVTCDWDPGDFSDCTEDASWLRVSRGDSELG